MLQAIYIFKMSFQDIMFQAFIINIYTLGAMVSLCNVLRMDEVAKPYTLFVRYEKWLTGKA